MGLIIRVDGVDWSGKGFPLAKGFVAPESLRGAFDLRPRTGRLKDVSGNGFVAVPYRNKLDNTVLLEDPTVLQDTANGLGLIVRNGALDFKIPNLALPIGGTVHFTTMIVGGYSGIPFDTGQPANNAIIANLADMGNGASAGDVPPVLQQYRVDTSLGARIRANAASNIGSPAALGQKSCFFLTFDGTKFTYRNMTTGSLVEKTPADLGIVASVLTPAAITPTMVAGNYVKGTTAIIGLYPELYQVAQWNKVLSLTEMQDQYSASKAVFSAVGI